MNIIITSPNLTDIDTFQFEPISKNAAYILSDTPNFTNKLSNSISDKTFASNSSVKNNKYFGSKIAYNFESGSLESLKFLEAVTHVNSMDVLSSNIKNIIDFKWI